MGRFDHLIPSGGGTATLTRPSTNRFAHLIPSSGKPPERSYLQDLVAGLKQPGIVGEALTTPAALTPAGETAGQLIRKRFNVPERVEVTPRNVLRELKNIIVGTDPSAYERKPGEPQPFGLPKGREATGEYLRTLLTGAASDVADIATNPLNVALGPILKGVVPLAGKIPIGKSTVGKIAQAPLKYIPTMVSRGAEAGTIELVNLLKALRAKRAVTKAGPVGEAARMPKQLGFQSFQMAPEEEVVRSQFQRLRGGGVPVEQGAVRPQAAKAWAMDDVIRYFREMGRGGQARIGKSFEGQSEEDLKRAIQYIKGGRRLTEAPMPQAKPAPVQTKNVQVPPTLSPAQNKLLAILTEAKPIRAAQEELYSAERGARFGKAQATGKFTKGQSGFYAELGQLKGELPKAQFQSIRGKMSDAELDSLFDQLKNSTKMDYLESITARSAFGKMLDGRVPTEGELGLLKREFGARFVKELESKLPLIDKLKKIGFEIGASSRAFMASFDLSAPLRQGWFFMGRSKRFAQAFKRMFPSALSEESFQKLQQEIRQRPNYGKMKAARLALTDLDSPLVGKEEAFMSNFAERTPVVGKVVRGSNRAYVSFLNKMRADVFDDLISKYAKRGLDVSADSPLVRATAEYINNATGRGTIPALKNSVPVLNAYLFSPRLMASRLNLMNPVYYARLPKPVRIEALKDLARSTAIFSTVLSLAKLGGAEVELDPTATDFGKVKIGKTRYDFGGGFLQYIRLFARLAAGRTKNAKGKVTVFGKGNTKQSRLSVLTDFLKYKQSPMVSLATTLLSGKDVAGKPIDIGNEVVSRFIPMVIQDFNDLINEWGPAGLVMGVPSVFGVSSQTY